LSDGSRSLLPSRYGCPPHHRRSWVVASVVVAVGTWLLSLAPAVRSASREEPLDPWDMRLIHSAGLGAFGVVYVAMAHLVSIRTLRWGRGCSPRRMSRAGRSCESAARMRSTGWASRVRWPPSRWRSGSPGTGRW
jgi:hypothetical protein